MTPEQRDEIRLTTMIEIMAALAPQGFAKLQEISAAADGSSPEVIELTIEAAAMLSISRAEYAAQEANALLATYEQHTEAERDGEPVVDMSQRYCAHGVAMTEPCEACRLGGLDMPTSDNGDTSRVGDGAALAAFNAGLQGGAES